MVRDSLQEFLEASHSFLYKVRVVAIHIHTVFLW